MNASCDTVFDLLHDYSRRLEWDPFLREPHLLDDAVLADAVLDDAVRADAVRADSGVKSRYVARWSAGGCGMDTVYVSFKRPFVAAVNMMSGPYFLKSFAASIRPESVTNTSCRFTYRYNLSTSRFLGDLTSPIVQFVFQRETSRRLVALNASLKKDV